jgi:hypothetical protein
MIAGGTGMERDGHQGGGGVRATLQGIFVLAGITLMIAGRNSNRSLVIVGIGLLTLAVISRLLQRGAKQ